VLHYVLFAVLGPARMVRHYLSNVEGLAWRICSPGEQYPSPLGWHSTSKSPSL
jgi:hypothetical protein